MFELVTLFYLDTAKVVVNIITAKFILLKDVKTALHFSFGHNPPTFYIAFSLLPLCRR